MKKVIKILTNKYLVVAICFVAWIAYFDQNDWMTLRERQHELDNVKDNIAYLKKEIAAMQAETKSLSLDVKGRVNNPAALEKYARENFRMKNDGEDIYVIED